MNPYGRFAFPLRLALMAVATAIGALAATGSLDPLQPPPVKRVQMPATRAAVPIVGWHSIPETALSEARFRELADMGLTHSLMHYSPAGNRKALDMAAAAGVQLFVGDDRLVPGGSVEEVAEAYRGHRALAGYTIRDEPSLADFAGLAKVRDALKAADPEHWSYVNLFPTYASAAQLGCDSYPGHVGRFLMEFRPEVLSFDHYPVLEGDRVREDYFQNLEWIRHAALEHGVPFWAFALACPHKPYPMPTVAHVRLQAWSNFAYGARGLQYFTYWTPTPGTWDFHDAPIRADGTRSATYDLLREFNRDVQTCADVLMRSRVVGVFHSAPVPAGTRGLDVSCPFSEIRGGECIVGVHQIENGRRYALVVNRSLNRAGRIELALREWLRKVSSEHAVGGAAFRGAKDGSAVIELEPGAGILLRLE